MGDVENGIFSSLPCLAIYFGNKKYNTIWKMPSVLLSNYLSSELAGPDPWTEDVVLFAPHYDRQLLVHDAANCRAIETLFKMCAIEYTVQERANAEFMSPSGKLPLVSFGSFILTDLERTAAFFKEKGYSLGEHLTEEKERSDMRSFLSPIKILLHAELYFCWVNDEVYESVTKRRYGSVFPFPLNHILPWRKRREVLQELAVFQWKKKTVAEVYKEVDRCLKTFSDHLGDSAWLFGAKPTEVDALLYGHLYAILTSKLPNVQLSQIVENYPNLISYYERIQKRYFEQT